MCNSVLVMLTALLLSVLDLDILFVSITLLIVPSDIVRCVKGRSQGDTIKIFLWGPRNCSYATGQDG